MTVVYLDSVFVLNGAVDYLVFLVTATLAGIPLRRKRYLLAGLLGGLYAMAVFLPGLEGLAQVPAKAAAGVLLCLLAFGVETRLWRLILLTLTVACAMAGCIFALSLLTGIHVPIAGGIYYTDVDALSLLLVAAGIYLVIRVLFRGSAGHALRRELLDATVSIGGRQIRLTALRDSGNALRNPVDGSPVLVVAPESLCGILPQSAVKLLTPLALRAPAELLEPLMKIEKTLRPQLLPYRAVGTVGGLLLAICCDWAVIGGRRYEKLVLALSPNPLGEGYSALWGGEIHETLEMADGLSANVRPFGGCALHRGQRYPSAAAGSGAGSCAAGSIGGRSSTGRADRT